MTQLELLDPCRVPKQGTQCYELLKAMEMGVRLTVAKALNEYGCYALSQRIGDLRKTFGWKNRIKDATVEGERHKVYWMEPQP